MHTQQTLSPKLSKFLSPGDEVAILGSSLGAIASRKHQDLLKGLSSSPKRIPSKYFYDDKGSRIFARITELEEYYPTRCEDEILSHQSRLILELCAPDRPLNVIELGAGDGRKTCHLLKAALACERDIVYRPVDISPLALKDLTERIGDLFPDLKVEPRQIDLEKGMKSLPVHEDACNLVLFLGSSIGNYEVGEQREFLNQIRGRLNPGDFLLIGFDLKKDPTILRPAYDDSKGITREFNMNLIRRLNREFEADFDEKQFRHLASYNPGNGSMESWLISQKEQAVALKALGVQIHLEAFEGIHVETSWKFSRGEMRALAMTAGFCQMRSFYDQHHWFVDELWEPGEHSSARL